jgi:ElaA protein
MTHAAAPTSVPPRVLYRIMRLRCEVFVVEQACAYLDLDGRDFDDGTLLVWADPDPSAPTVAATARVLMEGDAGARRIGRVATAPAWRRHGLAAAVVDHALTLCGEAPVVLDAQAHLAGWYERRGFERAGPPFDEDGIAHVPMRRRPPG